jgi:hypothetical protein
MKRNLHLFLLLIAFNFSNSVSAQQLGGQSAFPFLRLTPSARLMGLAGSQIALGGESDLALAYVNPALLSKAHHNALTFNHQLLFGGVGTGYAGYGYHLESIKTSFQAGLQYASYGDFQSRDEYNTVVQESFKASDLAFSVDAGRAINERFSVGVNLKFLQSRYENYKSTGISADLAGSYWHLESNWGVSLVLRHVGVQFSQFSPTPARANFPFDLQIGATKRLKKAPLRLSVVAHNLQKWNLRYENPEEKEQVFLGEEAPKTSNFAKQTDNLFRHLNFGAEILIGKKEVMRLRLGYNHQQRREMKVLNTASSAGFTVGFGLKIKRFQLDYAFNRWHTAGGSNHFSLLTHFGSFK